MSIQNATSTVFQYTQAKQSKLLGVNIFMQFIVMDLEWNNAYCQKIKGYINEIIEIGAVKVDSEMNVTDKFSVIIKAQVNKKIHGRIKALTHITNQEISNGVPFFKAFSMFKEWVGEEENVFLTWGDGDIRTMIKNYEFFLNKKSIPYVNNYCDAQKYCQSVISSASSSQQIGLSVAAVELGIDPDNFPHHRALDDSELTAACIKKVFGAQKITKYIRKCDKSFYDRLAFKPKIIKDINNSLVDKSKLRCVCDVCGSKVKKKQEWKFVNQSFRADFYCPHCDRNFKLCVRFKQYYDRIDVKRTFSEIVNVENEKSTRQNA